MHGALGGNGSKSSVPLRSSGRVACHFARARDPRAVRATEPQHQAGPPPEIREWIGELRGELPRALDALPGGAGARRYWRVRFERAPSAVLMHALPEDAHILPPALRRATDDLPFLIVSALLERHGLPVPARLGVHPSRRWVLLEDLGDRRLCDLAPDAQRGRRREAIELLVRTHGIPPDSSLSFQRYFDFEWILFELALFLDELAPELRAPLDPEVKALARRIEALPRVLCLRDYQSQNLMIDPQGRLRILDYQDALLGPPELDLVALSFDSYVEIEAEERRALLEHYGRLRGQPVDPVSFALLVVQRKCKDWSRFRHLTRRGDARYRPYTESARRAVLEAGRALPREHAELARLLERALAPERA